MYNDEQQQQQQQFKQQNIYTMSYSSRFTYLVRIYSTEISILVSYKDHYYRCCTRMTRTATTKSNIILLYNVHTIDHMILVHTAECAAVVLVPGTYVFTCVRVGPT